MDEILLIVLLTRHFIFYSFVDISCNNIMYWCVFFHCQVYHHWFNCLFRDKKGVLEIQTEVEEEYSARINYILCIVHIYIVHKMSIALLIKREERESLSGFLFCRSFWMFDKNEEDEEEGTGEMRECVRDLSYFLHSIPSFFRLSSIYFSSAFLHFTCHEIEFYFLLQMKCQPFHFPKTFWVTNDKRPNE